MTLNAYAPNNRATKRGGQKPRKLKTEIDNSTIMVGDFGPLVSNLLNHFSEHSFGNSLSRNPFPEPSRCLWSPAPGSAYVQG